MGLRQRALGRGVSAGVTLAVTLSALGLISMPGRTAGSEFFVAPNGAPWGDGSAANPWDLQTALNHPSVVTPGSTIWVREGTYAGAFTSRLSGTASAPIVVRNYRGERVTIDNRTDCSTYVIHGNYSWHWGLEVMSSGSKRRTPYAESDCADTSLSVHLDRGLGFRNYGSYTRLINNVVHDTQNGVSNWGTWTSGPGMEIYGNLIYYNGWEQTPIGRGHGHGTYTLSKSNGQTRVVDNIMHTQFSQGIRMGDEGVFNPYIEGNISYLNGEHMTPMGGRNLYVGGGNNYDIDRAQYVPMSGALIASNYTYYRPNTTGAAPGNSGASEGLNAGLWWPGASGQILNNYLAGFSGGHALQLGYWDHFTATACSGNTVYGSTDAYAKQQCPSGPNTYYSSKPGANAVFVRPNRYEPGRAHIAIYNWRNLSSVAVNLAAAGLAEGQSFEVRDAMNFYGAPVASGTFATASPTVAIPMTGLTRAPMMGEGDVSPEYRPRPHSTPEFGAFIVVPTAQGPNEPLSPQPPDPTPLPGPSPEPAPGIPGAPRTFTAKISGTTVVLSWRPPSSGAAPTGYLLEVGSSAGASNLMIYPTGNVKTSLTATGVARGRYFVRLRATNANGVSAASTELIVDVKSGSVAPGAPNFLTAVAADRNVRLAWQQPVGGDPPTSYIIEVGSAQGQSNLGQFSTGNTALSFSASDVPPGTYYLRVRAVNASGVGPPSNEVKLIVR